jgi:hypothetical protein
VSEQRKQRQERARLRANKRGSPTCEDPAQNGDQAKRRSAIDAERPALSVRRPPLLDVPIPSCRPSLEIGSPDTRSCGSGWVRSDRSCANSGVWTMQIPGSLTAAPRPPPSDPSWRDPSARTLQGWTTSRPAPRKDFVCPVQTRAMLEYGIVAVSTLGDYAAGEASPFLPLVCSWQDSLRPPGEPVPPARVQASIAAEVHFLDRGRIIYGTTFSLLRYYAVSKRTSKRRRRPTRARVSIACRPRQVQDSGVPLKDPGPQFPFRVAPTVLPVTLSGIHGDTFPRS